MIKNFLTLITAAMLLVVGCTSRLGFKNTYVQNDGITESTQGLSADITIDGPK